MCNLCERFVIHHDQMNWRLQQNSNASVSLCSVLPDGLRPRLMLTSSLRALGPVNHLDSFMEIDWTPWWYFTRALDNSHQRRRCKMSPGWDLCSTGYQSYITYGWNNSKIGVWFITAYGKMSAWRHTPLKKTTCLNMYEYKTRISYPTENGSFLRCLVKFNIN